MISCNELYAPHFYLWSFDPSYNISQSTYISSYPVISSHQTLSQLNEQRWEWNHWMERVLGLDGEAVEGGHTGPKVEIFFSNFSTFMCSHFPTTYCSYILKFSQICSYLLIISWYIPESKACETPLKRWTPTRMVTSLSASSSSWWPSDYLTFTLTFTFNILNKLHHIKQLMTK